MEKYFLPVMGQVLQNVLLKKNEIERYMKRVIMYS